MQTFEEFKRNTSKEALDKLPLWKQEHGEEYSHFCLDMMKVMHNDYSCLERVFKMTVRYVPVAVLTECQKLFAQKKENKTLSKTESEQALESVVDDVMSLKGYLSFNIDVESFDSQGNLLDEEDESSGLANEVSRYRIIELGLSEHDMNEQDEQHLYLPLETVDEFWEALPSAIQLIAFNICKGQTAEEMATTIKRIMIAACLSLNKVMQQLQDSITNGKDTLLMNALYFVCFDHGLPKMALALSDVSLSAKQITYLREGIKTVIEKAVETSVANGYDSKSIWTDTTANVPDEYMQQTISTILKQTKGKHGRPRLIQEQHDIDDYIIGDKSAIKELILEFLSTMERDYDLAFLKEALLRSDHLTDVKFAPFYHAICTFAQKDYEYDRAQRMNSLIEYNQKKFDASRKPTVLRGKRIIKIWRVRFLSIP